MSSSPTRGCALSCTPATSKTGSSTCDDARFADLAALYDTFADPFALTPGDNEWTDCHRCSPRRSIRGTARTGRTCFGKSVLLVHGDEHIYEVEPGYAGVPNLTHPARVACKA